MDEVAGSGVVRVAMLNYVMVRCVEHGPTLAVRACERIFGVPVDGIGASVHFGVVADLAVMAPDPLTSS
jgi:hypothetical protein